MNNTTKKNCCEVERVTGGHFSVGDTRICCKQELVKETGHEYLKGYQAGMRNERRVITETLLEWAHSPQGATGMDMRGRRWIDLDNLAEKLRKEV